MSGLIQEPVSSESAHSYYGEGCLGTVKEFNCLQWFDCCCLYEYNAVVVSVSSLQLRELPYFASEVQSIKANSVGVGMSW